MLYQISMGPPNLRAKHSFKNEINSASSPLWGKALAACPFCDSDTLGPAMRRAAFPLLPPKSRASLRLCTLKTRLSATGAKAKLPANKCTNPGRTESVKAKPVAQNGQPCIIFWACQAHGSSAVPVGTRLHLILGPASPIWAEAGWCTWNNPLLENVGHHTMADYYFIIFRFCSACNSS